MLKNKYLSILTAVMISLPVLFIRASHAEGLNISLLFSNGLMARPETVTGQQDAYWFTVSADTPLDNVLLQIESQNGEQYSPQSGTYLSFPDAGSRLAGAAYVPVHCMDAQGRLIRTIRLYVSTARSVSGEEEEKINLPARLVQDTQVLDGEGNPHALSGTLAKDTLVRVTGKRFSEQGALYRVDLNGELVYVPESALSFDPSDVSLSLGQVFSPEDPDDNGFTYAVTVYEAGIRSGKGNNDRNLLARARKNTLVFVFSRIPDDDGKLLDLVYCPSLGLFGYIHDTQLKILTAEEAETMFSVSNSQDEDTEFQEASVQEDTQLFSYPDSKSEVIAALAAGRTVYVYTRIDSSDGGWYLSQADDLLGYVKESNLLLTNEKKPASDLLTGFSEDQALKTRYAAVISSEILLYEAPSLSAACVGRVSNGEILTVQSDHLEAEGLDWVLVSAGDLQGYVLGDQTERLQIGSYLLGTAGYGEAEK